MGIKARNIVFFGILGVSAEHMIYIMGLRQENGSSMEFQQEYGYLVNGIYEAKKHGDWMELWTSALPQKNARVLEARVLCSFWAR